MLCTRLKKKAATGLSCIRPKIKIRRRWREAIDLVHMAKYTKVSDLILAVGALPILRANRKKFIEKDELLFKIKDKERDVIKAIIG